MTQDPKKNRLTKVRQDNPGFFTGMSRTIRLVLRLLGDSRVNFFLKLIPIGALVYMVVPEAFPVVDDALVIGVGTYLFIELCPPDVVEEHRARLAGLDETDQASDDNSEVVDSLFTNEKDQ